MRAILPTALLSVLTVPTGRAAEIAVTPRPFVIEHTLTATALPDAPGVLKLEAEGWPAFEIHRIAPHGSHVMAGDLLVEFDTEALDKKLDDSKRALDAATLGMEQAESDLKALKDGAPLKLEAVKRAARNAADDLDYFTKLGRKAQEGRSAQMLKRSQEGLENAREELRQLEKMYKADDLVEETEEIILVRQRDAVAAAEFALRMAEMENKRTLETALPRMAEDLDAAARTSAQALAKAQADTPRQITLKEMEVANGRIALARQKEDFAKLAEARRQAGPVKATEAGWFYHGGIEEGRWSPVDPAKGSLQAHSVVAARKAYATFIPGTAPLGLVAFVDEGTARGLTPASAGMATLSGREDVEIPATVKMVAPAPGTDGRYRVDLKPVWPVIKASWQPDITGAAPGSTAQVRLVSYQAVDAIVVPAAALKPGAGGWTVNVKLADGKSAPHPVKRGHVSGDQVEILSGLEAGQVVITP